MATWQSEIYRSLIAETVKTEYRKLLAVKKTDDEAEQIIVDYCIFNLVSTPQDERDMWLALALCQWEHGRLSKRTKEKAEYWLQQAMPKIRTEALKKLDLTLNSPMPVKKPVPPPSHVRKCPWSVGTLLAYRIVSSSSDNVKNGPFWKNYVLLRIVQIIREPYTYLAPDAVWNEGMLVGLYDWYGKEIPDPSLVNTLTFTPIVVRGPSLPSSAFELEKVNTISGADLEGFRSVVESLTNQRVETCCRLDWTCAKGIKRSEVYTYLGNDPWFQTGPSDFFRTKITDYSFCHSVPFDVILHNRLMQLSREREEN